MNIFKWSLSLLFLALIVFACEKDNFGPDLANEINPTGQPLTEPVISQVETPSFKLKKELAIGLSSAVQNHPEILKLFTKSLQKNASRRLPAITLINNLDRPASKNGETLGELLLANATELKNLYLSVTGLKEEITKVDPLISFKIPSVWYDYDFVAAKSEPVVYAFETKELQASFVKGYPIKLDDTENYFAINVQTSEEHMLVEMDDAPGDDSVFDYMLSCDDVRRRMSDMVQYDPSILVDIDFPDNDAPVIIVDIYEDIRDVYAQSCVTPINSASFREIMTCDSLCKRDCGREDNRLMGIELSSLQVLNAMGRNAPGGQLEGDFVFHISFVNANRESPIASHLDYYYPFVLEELIEFTTTVTVGTTRCEYRCVRPGHECEWVCWTPTSTNTAIVDLKFLELNEGAGMPLFGFSNPVQNEWNYQRYGDAMKISYQETDNITYNNQQSEGTSEQRSYQVGVSVSAGFNLEIFNMSTGLNYGSSTAFQNTSQTSLSFAAASLTQMGDALVGFCDEPNEDFSEKYNTGMIKSHVVYYLPQ